VNIEELPLDTATIRRNIIETWASAWSETDEKRRLVLLKDAAAPSCAYMDPNTELVGHAAISIYMAGFQESAPGARFVNTDFKTHHDRCIVQWNLVARDGKVLSPGVSAGAFDAQGRLQQMVGFFDA
jgi:SnoaL-like domain